MAPHWKCGLGQPIAGSNPALSATSIDPGPGAYLRVAARVAARLASPGIAADLVLANSGAAAVMRRMLAVTGRIHDR